MLNIGLVDDQELVRKGIAGLLALSGKATVGWEANNGAAALIALANNPVDVILADIRMPVMDGIELVKALRAQQNFTPVLMLTTFDDSELFVQSLKAGANGFLLKDVSLQKLVSSLEALAQGADFLAEAAMLQEFQRSKNIEQKIDLSQRELQILRLLAGGFSNKEIARAVFLAEGTVRNHVSNLLAKLDCRDRTQAVLKAINLGIV
ncbi:MAG: response regulator transcription factor [Cellvibrio sp.]|uniref:response regulator n=1 Tax=Cellvibrio sp. TaxID=1965322 RepID=UPI0027272BD1|nr:response regulator transcription factor [Cellvibrio sp.]